MKTTLYSFLCLFLLFCAGCEKDDVGDIVAVGLEVHLLDADGGNLLEDTAAFDPDQLDLAYWDGEAYAVYRDPSSLDVKGFDILEDGEGVKYLSMSIDEQACRLCGLPSMFAMEEGTLEGTFRFEYPDKRFPPVHFQVTVEKMDENRHIYLSTVRVEGQEALYNSIRAAVEIEIREESPAR